YDAGQQWIQSGELRRHPDTGTYLGCLAHGIVSGDKGPARGGTDQRGQDVDRGRLAGAVVAKQAAHGPGRNREAHAAQRRRLSPECLCEADNLYRLCTHGASISWWVPPRTISVGAGAGLAEVVVPRFVNTRS